MKNMYDSWAMFHSTDMGKNLEKVVETEDCKVLRMKDPSGDGLMTIYRVFDGVSVHIPQKTTTAIVGSSGGGKTTLYHLTEYAEKLSKGHVYMLVKTVFLDKYTVRQKSITI